MFHATPNSTTSSSYFLGGIDALPSHPSHSHHPAIDLGDESRLAGAQWMTTALDCASPQYIGDNMQMPPNLSSTLPSPVGDNVFSFRSTSSESSPHMSHLAMHDSPDSPNGESTQQKNTLRRSQNRQAQRRFRERKEQQKASLLAQLEALQSKHNKMAEVLETMRQSNTSLESNKRRLEKEVETLRKWREKILGVMENIVKPDGAEDDLLMKVATSCSPDCWRRGMEYSRTVIVMQTLLGIFGDDGEGQGPQTAGLRPASSQRGGDGESSMEVCAGDHNDTNEKKDRCT